MLPTSRSGQAEPFHAASGLEQVSSALDRVPLREDAVTELRAAICEYVRTQKGAGAPPEAVLARIKAVVQSFPPSRWGNDYTVEIQRALVSVVVDWCISAYYEQQ